MPDPAPIRIVLAKVGLDGQILHLDAFGMTGDRTAIDLSGRIDLGNDVVTIRANGEANLAIVQGGLTTTMELAALKTPFLYFPLRNHFEQNLHVRHRLERYGAGRCMNYETNDSDAIAAAIAEEIGREPDYREVEADGAARAAASIAELL